MKLNTKLIILGLVLGMSFLMAFLLDRSNAINSETLDDYQFRILLGFLFMSPVILIWLAKKKKD